MKKTTLSIVLYLSAFFCAFSQDISLKYGKITDDELKMTVYDKDSSAVAVVLYNNGVTYYDYLDGFRVVTEIRKKIKILKPDGVDEATIIIPYYKSDDYEDRIASLDATTYNLEGGKIVKSKLKKDYIFDEMTRKNYYRKKFTMPNVKAGSVIEYKYKIISKRYYDIPDQSFQENIPTINLEYEADIPEYFIYNIASTGYEPISAKEKEGTQTFSLMEGGRIQNVQCSCTKKIYTMHDIPALKDEPYLWCKDDFRSGIKFELTATNYPYDIYRSYQNTWKDLEKLIKKSDFISNTQKSNPYKKEIAALLSDQMTDQEKISTVFAFVKSKIKWNDVFEWNNNPSDAIKKGTGSNAQINSVLIRALNDAGFMAYPVLLSSRSNGRLPYSYPSYSKLNTYVVGVQTADAFYYLDGSSSYGGIDLLPTELLVDRAYAMNDNLENKFVNLTSLTRNAEMTQINASLSADGGLKATMIKKFYNLEAYAFKKQYCSKKDSADYVENIEAKNDLKVDNLKIGGMNLLSNISTEQMSFTKKYEMNGDFIYINPVFFPEMTENIFTQSNRMLPIEFSYPYKYSYHANIVIPEGYTVAELPKSARIELNDRQGQCKYITVQEGNTIQILYEFELKQIIFPASEYAAVRGFWGQLVMKNNEMIVLKKI